MISNPHAPAIPGIAAGKKIQRYPYAPLYSTHECEFGLIYLYLYDVRKHLPFEIELNLFSPDQHHVALCARQHEKIVMLLKQE